jgi:hypothetical protein
MTSMLVETNFSSVETLSESNDGKKDWFITGIFAQGDVVNRNRRVYPNTVLEASMNEYDRDFVQKNRAVGEAEHPATTKINLDRISHVIVPGSLIREGNDYTAKAKILNTPCGNIVKGLLEGGVQIGVSTRADGKVKANSRGIMEVQNGLKMSSIDIVFAPSAPSAFVEGLMEGADFIWDTTCEDFEFIETLKEDISSTRKADLMEAKFVAFQKFMQHIRNRV